MYQRFKRALFKPRELGLYFKDSWAKVITYFFLLCFVLMLPIFAIEATYSGFDTKELRAIDENYEKVFVSELKIIDGILIYPIDFNQGKELILDNYKIAIAPKVNTLESITTLIFREKGIDVVFLGLRASTVSYQDLDLVNFDFSDYSTNNKLRLIHSLNDSLKQNNVINKTVNLILTIFATVFDLLIIILIASFFGPIGFPFKLKLKLAIYASTIYALTALFAILFNVKFLVYIGMVLFVIYIKRALSTIIVR